MKRPKKGARLVYTGPYATPDVPPYPPGTVVAYRTNRFHGPTVTVKLDDGDYTDWPIKWTKETP